MSHNTKLEGMEWLDLKSVQLGRYVSVWTLTEVEQCVSL
jgi:hypothetical protein